MSTPRIGVAIVAAGSGTRFGSEDKALASLAGEPLLAHSLRAIAACPRVSAVALVMGSHTIDRARELAAIVTDPAISVCLGGATRTASTRAGLAALPDVEIVAIHDAARPLVTTALLDRVLDAAVERGAAVPVLPVSDSVYCAPDGLSLARPLERAALRAAQTPQAARRDWLLRALDAGDEGTDEGTLLHRAGYPVTLVAGDPDNMKVTWPRDLRVAEALLAGRAGTG